MIELNLDLFGKSQFGITGRMRRRDLSEAPAYQACNRQLLTELDDASTNKHPYYGYLEEALAQIRARVQVERKQC